MSGENIETLLKQQGEAFDAFKATMGDIDKEVKKLGNADGLLTDRLQKIEASLDDAVEAKAALEAKIAAERKDREELELKLGRMNISGHSEESAKRELEIKSFNDTLASIAAGRNRGFQPLDGKGYDAYKAAQDHFFREGKENLTADEVKTLSVGSDPDGGYYVTPDLSGRIVKKVYETSPVRQYVSAVNISTDALEGIEDLGEAGAGYAGETAQGSDTTTPQVGKWRIPVYWIDTEPKATQQLLDDAAVDVEPWLPGKVSDKFARFEETEVVTGASKIRGFVSGYATAADSGSGVTWGNIGYVYTGVSSDFAAADKGDKIYELIGTLKNQYLANAAFFTRRSVITKIRQFKVSGTGTAYLWEPSFQMGQPERIAGYPVVRMEDMPALASGSLSMAFGDLREAYQIVDRMGIRVMRDPFTSKPFIKFYTTKRTGGGVVNFEAIKLMKFGTS